MNYLKPLSTALFSALMVSGAHGQVQATLMAPQDIGAQWVGGKMWPVTLGAIRWNFK